LKEKKEIKRKKPKTHLKKFKYYNNQAHQQMKSQKVKEMNMVKEWTVTSSSGELILSHR